MIEIELDGKKIDVAEGSMVMHAAEKAGTYIPHFCYHKKLSIAASCRMCLVDVEKMPKPMPACATPVTKGMVVRTKSEKAVKAQQSVMEFLLINHPLDCPICDQGGECQLQDLAVGYGATNSRYAEDKRVVSPKDVGSLISMSEMSRCIHCTRCVRFGQEVAGVMELGMSNRGEHAEIETFVGQTIDSELSGNMIDLCPVGALTSKPFRYSARTWELSRRRSISPHDSTGSNLIVQVKGDRVMRVLPLENDQINECWLADRDRFSYEALNSADRLTEPMLKQGGAWTTVDWKTALEYVASGLKDIAKRHGGAAIGALLSPHSTLEELHMTASLVRGLGSDNVDYRLRNMHFEPRQSGARYLGMRIADLSNLQRVLVIGSDLRKDHPLFALRLRQAVRSGCVVNAVVSVESDWAMPVRNVSVTEDANWVGMLADVATAVAAEVGSTAPVQGEATSIALAIAKSLLSGDRKAVLLGNAAAHSNQASQVLALANWIAVQTGATVGYLTEAANTVGAQLVGAMPGVGGAHVAQMLSGNLRAAMLLNCEPRFDTALRQSAIQALSKSDLVVTLSPFKANLDISDVLLPISPFTETPGTFINAEGRMQSFHAVVKPLGQTRPAWKVLRALADMLELPNLAFESSQDVLESLKKSLGVDQYGFVSKDLLSNTAPLSVDTIGNPMPSPIVGIYQLDGIVRRASSLQLTADARNSQLHEVDA